MNFFRALFLLILVLAVVDNVCIAQNIKPFRELDTSPDEQKLDEIATYYFKGGQFHEAIVPLEELVAKTDKGQNVQYRKMLADAYFNTNCYEKALEYYQDLVEQNPNEFPMIYYNLGLVYKGMERYTEAEVTLKYFVANFSREYPNEAKAASKEIANCGVAKTLLGTSGDTKVSLLRLKGYSQKILSGISCENTVYTVIKAIKMPMKQSIGQDIIVEIDSIKVTRLFENKNGSLSEIDFNIDPKANIGSPAFSEDCRRLYYTICSSSASQDICEVYYSDKIGASWTDPVKLNDNINHLGYSSKNPTLIEIGDGKNIMLFSSDRPGGQGQFDIWMSETDENGNFQPPKNLGNGINTSKNEVTPFFDVISGYLFFSSNGHSGRGGLDVYMAKMKWTRGVGKIYNLGKPINSGMDDFHFYLKKGTSNGYLTSNRSGCIDQIFQTNFNIPFEYTKLPNYVMEVDQFRIKDTDLNVINEFFNYSKLEMKGTESMLLIEKDALISGTLFNGNQELEDHKVLLIDENGEVMDVAVTDKMGNFQFRKLPTGGKYALVLAEEDASMNLNVTMIDGNGKVIGKYDGGKFNYRLLEDYNTNFFRLTENEASMSGSLVSNGVPVAGHKVFLMDENDDIVDVALTDDKGNFDFKRLPSGGKYSIFLDEKDAKMDVTLLIRDSEGNIVDKIKKETESDIFKYKPSDAYNSHTFKLNVNDSKITGSVYENGKKANEGHKILLVDENAIIVSSAITDKSGNFEFMNLPNTGNYAFVLAKSDQLLQVDMFLLNDKGHVSKHISSETRKTLFNYRDLEESDEAEIIENTTICGTLLAIDDEMVENYAVILINSVGMALDTTMVNKYGHFRFNKIEYSPAQIFAIDNCLAHLPLQIEVTYPDEATAHSFNTDSEPERFIYKNMDRPEQMSDTGNTLMKITKETNEEETSMAAPDESEQYLESWWVYLFLAIIILGVAIFFYKKRNA